MFRLLLVIFCLVGVATVSSETITVETLIDGISHPVGCVFDSVGNLYITDVIAGTVSKRSAATGIVDSHFITGLSEPQSITRDNNDNLYITNSIANTVSKYNTATHTLSVLISSGGLNYPSEIVYHSTTDALYIANNAGNTISKFVLSTKTLTTFISSGLSGPSGIAFDSSSNIYISNQNTGTVVKYNSNGIFLATVISTGLTLPTDIACDSSGSVYVVNYGTNTVTKRDSTGIISTVISSGLNGPASITFDSKGNLYIANYANNQVVVGYKVTTPNPIVPAALYNSFQYSVYNNADCSSLYGSATPYPLNTCTYDGGAYNIISCHLDSTTGDTIMRTQQFQDSNCVTQYFENSFIADGMCRHVVTSSGATTSIAGRCNTSSTGSASSTGGLDPSQPIEYTLVTHGTVYHQAGCSTGGIAFTSTFIAKISDTNPTLPCQLFEGYYFQGLCVPNNLPGLPVGTYQPYVYVSIYQQDQCAYGGQSSAYVMGQPNDGLCAQIGTTGLYFKTGDCDVSAVYAGTLPSSSTGGRLFSSSSSTGKSSPIGGGGSDTGLGDNDDISNWIESSSKHLSDGAIIGIAIGSIVAFLALLTVGALCYRKNKSAPLSPRLPPGVGGRHGDAAISRPRCITEGAGPLPLVRHPAAVPQIQPYRGGGNPYSQPWQIQQSPPGGVMIGYPQYVQPPSAQSVLSPSELASLPPAPPGYSFVRSPGYLDASAPFPSYPVIAQPVQAIPVGVAMQDVKFHV